MTTYDAKLALVEMSGMIGPEHSEEIKQLINKMESMDSVLDSLNEEEIL